MRVGVGVRGQREVGKTLHPHPRCCLTRGWSFFGYTLRQFQKKVLAVLLKLIFQSGNTELYFFWFVLPENPEKHCSLLPLTTILK